MMQNRKADWVIFQEVLETGTKIFIKDISKIEKRWLLDGTLSSYYNVKMRDWKIASPTCP